MKVRAMRCKTMRAMTLAAVSMGSPFLAAPAFAQFPSDSLKTVLGNASDTALDKLSQPGAFSSDSAIRIGLPGAAGKFGDVLKFTDRIGATDDLSGQMNRAAEAAAAQAKPVFRSVISRLTVRDAIGIGTQGDTAATDFLKRNAGTDIVNRIMPLVKDALSRAGAFQQTKQLSAIGMNDEKITSYVAQKTADGIFTYMGREETRVRHDPTAMSRALTKGLKF